DAVFHCFFTHIDASVGQVLDFLITHLPAFSNYVHKILIHVIDHAPHILRLLFGGIPVSAEHLFHITACISLEFHSEILCQLAVVDTLHDDTDRSGHRLIGSKYLVSRRGNIISAASSHASHWTVDRLSILFDLLQVFMDLSASTASAAR